MIGLALPRTDDWEINRAYDLLERAFRTVDGFLFGSAARLVGPVPIATTDTRVRHGLGQRPRGYMLVKSPADVRIFDGAAAEKTDPDNFISLRASSAATLTLVVF